LSPRAGVTCNFGSESVPPELKSWTLSMAVPVLPSPPTPPDRSRQAPRSPALGPFVRDNAWPSGCSAELSRSRHVLYAIRTGERHARR
jgi:hypothetical protein